MNLDENYWSTRYIKNEIAWDLGCVSPPMKILIDGISDKETRILIPGAGNAYEAEYLFQNGFQNIFVLDISQQPLLTFKSRIKNFPDENLIHADFFDFEGEFDLILEQTFFCALQPHLRSKYVSKIYELLKPGGKLNGVVFGIEFDKAGPPFGGTINNYKELFSAQFRHLEFNVCENSIKPRFGNEWYILCTK